MKEVIIGLNWLDIIFLVIALLSLVGNLYQYMQLQSVKEELRIPIYNSIVGLFMDIKTKMKNAMMRQQHLVNPNNPHTVIDTLKWEYQIFALDVVNWMQGFHDELTGIISTLNPGDKKGEKIIKSGEFGLDDNEKETRNLVSQIYLNQLRRQAEENAPRPVNNAGQ